MRMPAREPAYQFNIMNPNLFYQTNFEEEPSSRPTGRRVRIRGFRTEDIFFLRIPSYQSCAACHCENRIAAANAANSRRTLTLL